MSYEITVLTGEERRGEQHRQRHPLGRVPVLELADGQTLFESAGICLYLTDRYPSVGLAPLPDSPDRPLVYQWAFFAMTEVEPAGELHEASIAETGVAPVNTRRTGPACVCRDRLRANGRLVLLGAERGRVADADRPCST